MLGCYIFSFILLSVTSCSSCYAGLLDYYVENISVEYSFTLLMHMTQLLLQSIYVEPKSYEKYIILQI